MDLKAIPRPVKTYHVDTYDRISKHHGFEGKGKTVLVTGGAGGIGYSISHAFAKAGVARVVIIARSAEPLKKAKKDLEAAYPTTQVVTFQASITDYSRVREIIQEVGTVDVLVLNATFLAPTVDTAEVELKDLTGSYETNVFAAVELVKAYLATPVPAAGSKTVISITSAVVQMSTFRMSAYASSKAAITQVMQNLAAEHADKGTGEDVRFFSYHPGVLATPGATTVLPKAAYDSMQWEDINVAADFALWLAGPESAFLSGRFVWAQWDVDELIELKERLAKDPSFLTIGLVL